MQILLDTVPPQASCVLHVDVKAIQENYKALRGFVRKGALCGAVLKGDAYGLGQDPIAKGLYDAGCRDFFFAYIDEAIQCRKILPHDDLNIYVFYGIFPRTEDTLVQHNLTPCLVSLDQVKRWGDHAKKLGRKLPCLLHVDTGMGREGVTQKELEIIMERDLLEPLKATHLMSHLANSNTPCSQKNQLQLDRFSRARKTVPLEVIPKATFANSSGITLGDNYQFDLVRPGMALYGYKDENYGTLLDLRPSLKVYARITLTRSVPKGETIGYNCTYKCEKDTRIALISLGHRDGLLREISNRGHILINGKPCPIIGTISMDVLMADITDQQEGAVHEGMWAEIYGDVTSTREFAENEGTSVYELLVRHGTRYHRIYT